VYKVYYTKQASKSLLKAPKDTAQMIREKIDQVACDPYAPIPNARKLEDRPGYRLRVGDWRVIYEIDQGQITIIVIKIALRGEVYR
jgi:mRNA interferase RelE/StbE